MKKEKNFILFTFTLLLHLLTSSIYSQTISCGTTFDSIPFDYNEIMLQPQNNSSSGASAICVDISFHILRNSSAVNAISESNVRSMLNELNEEFNQHEIFLYEKNLDYIINDQYFELNGNSEFNDLVEINNDPDALNIYIVDNYEDLAGRADGIPSSSFVIEDDDVLTSTNVHEIGHCFGLLHTHETANGIENIPRPGEGTFLFEVNCYFAGDGLCSTPADPKLLIESPTGNTSKVDSNCNYTENETRDGFSYAPETDNYMSYSRGFCRDNFTFEQVNVMRAMLQTEPVLQNVKSSSCQKPQIVGPSSYCYGSGGSYTYTLQNFPPEALVSWSSSYHFNFDGGNIATDNVEVIPAASGIATLTAEFNDYEVTKTIYPAVPESSSHHIETLWNFDIETNTISDVGVIGSPLPDGTEFDWEISPLNNSNCSQATFGYDNNDQPIISTTTSDPYTSVLWGTCGAYYTIKCWAKNDCGKSYVGEVNVIVKEVDCVE